MKFEVLLILFISHFSFAQVTYNPKIDNQSAAHVNIQKIEVTDEHTQIDMLFYEKNSGASKDLFKMFEGLGFSQKGNLPLIPTQQTISFQKDSRIILPDGKSVKFLRAEGIPVSPERQEVHQGKKYAFKVFFEKIPEGIERIDLLENDTDKDDDYQFWNFRGIAINNPKKGELSKVGMLSNFMVYGKLIDERTQTPIKGRVYCYNDDTGELIDNLETSKSGKYEFEVNTTKIRFEVEADSYLSLKESVNLSFFINNKSFEKDLFLNSENLETTMEEETLLPNVIEEGTNIVLDKVYFELGKVELLEDSFTQLYALVKYLKSNPSYKVKIIGHTDNQGDPKLNLELSKNRALNVYKYLVENGISKERISHTGLGGNKPVSPNNSEENRAKNRRVEFVIER